MKNVFVIMIAIVVSPLSSLADNTKFDLDHKNANPNTVAATDDLKPMNVRQMQMVSYFTENHSKNIGKIDFGVRGHVTLIVKPEEIAPYIDATDKKKYLGHKLYLVNQEHKAVSFPTSFSQLALTLIAKNRDGEWRPVEYSERHSDVAGAAYKVSLPKNHYWEFIAPKYEGTFKTKLRYVVGGRRRVYSNEFEGSINLEQFDDARSAYLKSQIVTINK
jgi:hypothetical protein